MYGHGRSWFEVACPPAARPRAAAPQARAVGVDHVDLVVAAAGRPARRAVALDPPREHELPSVRRPIGHRPEECVVARPRPRASLRRSLPSTSTTSSSSWYGAADRM